MKKQSGKLNIKVEIKENKVVISKQIEYSADKVQKSYFSLEVLEMCSGSELIVECFSQLLLISFFCLFWQTDAMEQNRQKSYDLQEKAKIIKIAFVQSLIISFLKMLPCLKIFFYFSPLSSIFSAITHWQHLNSTSNLLIFQSLYSLNFSIFFSIFLIFFFLKLNPNLNLILIFLITYYQFQFQSVPRRFICQMTICLYLSSAYVFTSFFFFCFPALLHRKAHRNLLFDQYVSSSKILRISHRGSPRYSTENTIQAFKKVLPVSDCLQMDVCQTLDKVLVVHHDQSLLRSCGVDKYVDQLTYKELPRYQDKVKLDFATDRFMTTDNQTIPKLETVFQQFQGIPMDIQLKTPTETATKQFVRLIKKYNRQSYTIIGIRNSKKDKITQEYQKIKEKKDENLLKFMSDLTVAKIFIAYVFGFLPFIKIKQSSLQIPIYSRQFEDWCVDRAKKRDQSILKIKIGCQILKLMNFLSRPLIWHLKQRGILTFGWVCNTQESLQRAYSTGVQGIMSDQPYQLDKFVSRKFEGKQKKY